MSPVTSCCPVCGYEGVFVSERSRAKGATAPVDDAEVHIDDGRAWYHFDDEGEADDD